MTAGAAGGNRAVRSLVLQQAGSRPAAPAIGLATAARRSHVAAMSEEQRND
jgi:hypothetical protein